MISRFRRGRKFGPIVVDLQTHRVNAPRRPDSRHFCRNLDGVPTQNWGNCEPRSRRGLCCCGLQKRLPRRFSAPRDSIYLPILGKLLEGVLARHLAAHRARIDLESRATPLSPVQGKGPAKKNPKHAQESQAKREERLAQYRQVVSLRKQGFSQTAIAAEVGVGHATVSRWLRDGTFPEHKTSQRRTKLDPHLKAVAERWEAGCHNIAQLHRNWSQQATPSPTATSTGNWTVPFQKAGRSPSTDSQLPRATVLARDAVFLFLRRPEELEAEDQETLALLRPLQK